MTRKFFGIVNKWLVIAKHLQDNEASLQQAQGVEFQEVHLSAEKAHTRRQLFDVFFFPNSNTSEWGL